MTRTKRPSALQATPFLLDSRIGHDVLCAGCAFSVYPGAIAASKPTALRGSGHRDGLWIDHCATAGRTPAAEPLLLAATAGAQSP
jgi:hypothetical protein